MVGAALEALRGEGIIKAALVVYTNNENGIRFWENYGFTSRDDLVYQNMILV
jgi:ribosomal protein S18 acetylase RimI-like enzyme